MRGMRLLIVIAAVAALAVAFVLVRPDDDDDEVAPPTTEPLTTTIRTPTETDTETKPTEPAPEQARIVVTVRDGRPVGGIARATANEGDPVLVIVRSNVADHVHVHGYDLFGDVGPGRPARMQFRASLTGRFEIELEDRGQQIAQLTVVP
jgi:hypothetical protein